MSACKDDVEPAREASSVSNAARTSDLATHGTPQGSPPSLIVKHKLVYGPFGPTLIIPTGRTSFADSEPPATKTAQLLSRFKALFSVYVSFLVSIL